MGHISANIYNFRVHPIMKHVWANMIALNVPYDRSCDLSKAL